MQKILHSHCALYYCGFNKPVGQKFEALVHQCLLSTALLKRAEMDVAFTDIMII